ncbi:hypothetical protein [Streptomyces sp. 6N106]|uniref:hypothetical protein n=1 Tax=Streptomyces sp. 6N106 TaxID=3457418 RepID=UPI003FD5CED1
MTVVVRDCGRRPSQRLPRRHPHRRRHRRPRHPRTRITLELAFCFHHSVRGDETAIQAAIARLRDLTQSGDYAYYIDIAHFMAGLRLPADHTPQTQCIDGDNSTRRRWRGLVTARRDRTAH